MRAPSANLVILGFSALGCLVVTALTDAILETNRNTRAILSLLEVRR
jgi:hypothetical protein